MVVKVRFSDHHWQYHLLDNMPPFDNLKILFQISELQYNYSILMRNFEIL